MILTSLNRKVNKNIQILFKENLNYQHFLPYNFCSQMRQNRLVT